MKIERSSGPLRVRISRANADIKTRQLLSEVQRKASMANKRLVRLENNNLTDLPAYKSWFDYGGGVKFSVAGKDYNQLQAELSRVNHFLDSKTSLVREANKYMKDIAKLTGVDYNKVSELPHKLQSFFSMAEKIEQYLRQVEGSASAIGYQKIWEVINKYVQDGRMDLDRTTKEVEQLIPVISQAVTSSAKAEVIDDIKTWDMWDFIGL